MSVDTGPPSDLERLGGEPALRAIVQDFIGRVSADFIIGFMFQGKDLQRIIDKEVELAARHLGGEAPYTGRPIAQVHRPLPINRGHFRRRLAFLRTTLAAHGVAEDIAARWISANEALEAAVTNGMDCAE
ncbi:MAG: group 1 truncated hemoglobin [Alphaproteobacteria bacterium]|nr:group 1 truncated hemoglobin [Alphaproteobacteria bacterium]